jgi:hypothetical protein
MAALNFPATPNVNQVYTATSGISYKWNGSSWINTVAYRSGDGVLIYVIDGGGSTITTGVKGDLSIPFGCSIVDWTLLGDTTGSIVIDLWKDTYANYPPTVADTITAAAKPTIASATKETNSTLTGWTTACAAGDTIRINVDSVSSFTRVTLIMKIVKL